MVPQDKDDKCGDRDLCRGQSSHTPGASGSVKEAELGGQQLDPSSSSKAVFFQGLYWQAHSWVPIQPLVQHPMALSQHIPSFLPHDGRG